MMKSKQTDTPEPAALPAHSKAPWALRFTDQYSAVGAHIDIVSADGTVVASVIKTGEQCRFEPATAANANLMLAAPALLANLEFAVWCLENPGMGPTPDALANMKAAIAKAKGGAV